MTIWHTTTGSVSGPGAEEILAQFGDDAFYRPDSNLRPDALGRVLVNGGERTAALLLTVGNGPAPDEDQAARALRRAGLSTDEEA
ncbi:hypothetical protein [Rhodococcus tibetensis]|uniref:Uncharacterized protein n=1 Tax=Rhodococcus tibetensis TaxID=2965064 RepID=A0ABT1QCA8_9NOCA|nr:hypothetical protein [Rhodococcus sp. FXJ9.536]MCQ4119909.1 hypothetical protein [Rhodococcus sp. FXJ9.536]